MYAKKMLMIFTELNSFYYDPTSDDQVKMREHVRHKKITKTIENLKKINTQNEGVHDFLPSWATNEYFDSLHGEKASEEAKTKVNIEEIKIYVEEVIMKARERVLKEVAALEVPQVPKSSGPLKINMYDRRKTMKAVHQQLLSLFNSEKRKRMMDSHDKIRKKTQQMMAVHAELKETVFVKGFGLGDIEDDCFVPRKLFLFEIEGF